MLLLHPDCIWCGCPSAYTFELCCPDFVLIFKLLENYGDSGLEIAPKTFISVLFLKPDKFSCIGVWGYGIFESIIMEGCNLLYPNNSNILVYKKNIRFFQATFSSPKHYNKLVHSISPLSLHFLALCLGPLLGLLSGKFLGWSLREDCRHLLVLVIFLKLSLWGVFGSLFWAVFDMRGKCLQRLSSLWLGGWLFLQLFYLFF